MNATIKKYIPWGIFVVIVIGFYILNATTPLLWDDFPYAFMFPDHPYEGYAARYEQEITSVWDIFVSQWNHYHLYNGRSIVHFIAQLFCWGGSKNAYNIFATLLFIPYVLLLTKLCFPEKRIGDAFLSIGCLGCLMLYLEEPSCLYRGICFGCNYLYSSVVWFTYIYLLCYRRTDKLWRSVAVILLSVFAGWSHEAFSIPFCSALTVWMYMYRKTLNKYEIVALALCYISTAIMVFAPGNLQKADYPHADYFSMIRPGVENYYLLALIAFWLILYKKYPKEIKLFFERNLPLIFGTFISFLFLTYIQMSDGRVRIGFQLMMFILYCRLLVTLEWTKVIKVLSLCGVIVVVVGLPLVIYYQIPAGREYSDLYAQCEDERNDTVVFQFKDTEMPQPIKKFVNRHSYLMTYWDQHYPIQHKKPVYVTDAPIVNYNYSKEDKIPGSNPFYKKGDYWITKEKLPKSVTVTVEQGDYQLWDLPTLMRRCYNIIKPIPATSMTFSLKSDSLCIGKDQYVYYVQQTDRTPRKILRVDVQP